MLGYILKLSVQIFRLPVIWGLYYSSQGFGLLNIEKDYNILKLLRKWRLILIN